MSKKKIIVIAGIILLVIITGLAIKKMVTPEKINVDEGFVFDRSSDIKLKDIETYYKVIDFKEEKENVKNYFKDGVINPYTVKFFKFLDEIFKDIDNEKDLFENVSRYLHSTMPADMADKLLDLYKKFFSYQMTAGRRISEWGGMPKSKEEVISFLHMLQDYRREIFGKEVADALFGASVKAEEYPLRRGIILSNKDMYGAEKEKLIQQLNEDMWGDEADKVDAFAEPYAKYKDKLAMYDKDLSELDDEGKKAQIRAFREELFTKDQIQRWENVEKIIADNRQKESDYNAREGEIMNDPDLNQQEKENRVQELQNQMYGEEAEAFRRSLAIKRASEKYLKK
ncbi:MAG: hypothetical protein JW976_10305 [Syntrophaceae bacterium]|nr:hypothetical protein [Syntrophaceae bacterium]